MICNILQAGKDFILFPSCTACRSAGYRITKSDRQEPVAAPFPNVFMLRDSSLYSGYQLTASGDDLILSKTSTPYTPSHHEIGSTVILQEGQAAPTSTPTVVPTPVVNSTIKPTTKPTETQSSPAPVAGILAGLGVAALVLARLRR